MTVLSLEGPAGAALFSRLQTMVRACSPQPVVLDITSLTIAGADGFRQLTAFLHWSSETLGRVCLVCRRLSARRLLHRSGATDAVPVFMTVEEAVGALFSQGPPAVPAGSPRAGEARAGARRDRSVARRARSQEPRTKEPEWSPVRSPVGGEA
ncbi:MAG: STAS domain-containing protein [Actinomycetota bacterium]|nr:STAS domain-containing protein [Actinomycetota bacterium]